MTPRTTTDRRKTRSRIAAACAWSCCCALPSAVIISSSSAREYTLRARDAPVGMENWRNGAGWLRRLLRPDRNEPSIPGNGERDRLREWRERHGRARIRVHRVLPVLLVPLRDRRRLLHLLDDVAPADAGVVRAERDLAHLRRVGDDAHLRATEIVGPQILEPHPRDEQDQPLVGLAVAVRRHPDAAERAAALLVELLDQIAEPEAFRRPVRAVVAQHAQRRLHLRQQRAARRVADRPRIVEEALDIEDRSEERRVGKECRSRWSPD